MQRLLVPYSALPISSLSRLYVFRQCLNASASISDNALQIHTDFLILCVVEGGWLRHLKLQEPWTPGAYLGFKGKARRITSRAV